MKSVIATVIFSAVMAAESYDDLVKKYKREAKDIQCYAKSASGSPPKSSPADTIRRANCFKAAEACVAAYGKATAECKPADKKVTKEAQAKMEKCFKTNVEKRADCGKAAFNGASTLIMGASAIAMAAALF